MLAVCNLHGNGSAAAQSRFALRELQTDRIKPVRKCLGTQRSKARNHGIGNLRASHVDQRLWDVWVPRIAAGIIYLAPHPAKCSSAPANGEAALEAGAPETEIEITPEMIAAGALALSSYGDAFESAEEAAVRIFREMNRLARISV